MTEKRFTMNDLKVLSDKVILDSLYVLSAESVLKILNQLVDENTGLQARNDRQAKRLGNLYNLIENEDWETLKGIIEEFKESDERLQKEYNYEGMLND